MSLNQDFWTIYHSVEMDVGSRFARYWGVYSTFLRLYMVSEYRHAINNIEIISV